VHGAKLLRRSDIGFQHRCEWWKLDIGWGAGTDLGADEATAAVAAAVVITITSAIAAPRGVLAAGAGAERVTVDGTVKVVEHGFAAACVPRTVFLDGAVTAAVRKRVMVRYWGKRRHRAVA
jgi:hypothetical protein